MRKLITFISYTLCCLLLVFCVIVLHVLVAYAKNGRREDSALQEVADLVGTDEDESEKYVTVSGMEGPVLNKYIELLSQNGDMIGWVRIDDTTVNYPVMYTPENPSYYLRRDFQKNDSMSGVPFLGEGCQPLLYESNLIIHGHNMRNGTMFSDLIRYTEESYFRSHPIVRFDTIYREGTYRVIAAFYIDIDDAEQSRLYTYTDLTNPAVREKFVEYYEARRLYSVDVTLKSGAQYLTFSTCGSQTDQRFILIAVNTADLATADA